MGARFGIGLMMVPVALSVLLLLALLLVSAQPGEDALRQLDLNVRQAAEIAPRVVDSALDGGPGAAGRTPVSRGLEALQGRLRRANSALDVLEPVNPPWHQRLRDLAVRAFNSIDVRGGQVLDSAALRAEFGAANAAAAAFATRAENHLAAHRRWSRSHEFIVAESRDLVGTLRREREDAAADLLFGSVEQLLERSRMAFGLSSAEISTLVATVLDTREQVAAEHGPRIAALADAMSQLHGQRMAVVSAADRLEESPLPGLLEALREQVGANMLHRMATVSDARVLLNVYTGLLLLVLVQFGWRLRASYQALNRSHEDLEMRVVERTRDLKQANEDLKESQVQLVQAEKMSSLGQLVAGVMHEINTPLMYVQSNVSTNAETLGEVAGQLHPALQLARVLRAPELDRDALKGCLQAVRKELDPDDLLETIEEIRQLSDDSMDGLGQIAELVQSLKDFSRMDRADEDRFDVREGLEKTLTITRSVHKYGVEVVRDFEDVPEIYCAPSKINQVFINLVNNAVQAMDGRGTLTLSTRSREGWVDIAVADTGCGIAAEHLDQIMDPFFTTKPVGQGTGLGLSIVRQIVDEHGGHLDVASVVGEGTTVTLSLPVRQTSTEEAA